MSRPVKFYRYNYPTLVHGIVLKLCFQTRPKPIPTIALLDT